jgi:hypothetical protein
MKWPEFLTKESVLSARGLRFLCRKAAKAENGDEFKALYVSAAYLVCES